MIIVFLGNIGTGKSTGATILKTKYNFEEIAFAEPIKSFALSLGFESKNVNGTQEEKTEINSNFGISGRQFMQVFGTDVMKSYPLFPNIQNIWVKVAELKLQNALKFNKHVVISDCRFLDEVIMLKKYNALFIKLERHCHFHSDHISEKELINFQNAVVYENNYSLHHFECFLDTIVNTKYDFYSFLKLAYNE